MSEVQKKDKMVLIDHRCFCRGNPLLGKIGSNFYEFKNNHPRFFLRCYFDGVVEVGCRYCYRTHKFRLKDLTQKLKQGEFVEVPLDSEGC